MVFRHAIVYAADVPATLDVSARAFGLDVLMLHESGTYGELDTGATKLAFSAHSLMESLGKDVETAPEEPAFEVALETGDVPAALAGAVAAGAREVQGVTAMPWGQTLAYVRAPEGTLVEICTPVATPAPS